MNRTSMNHVMTTRVALHAIAFLAVCAIAAPAHGGDYSACLDTQYGGSTGCTSNDVKVTAVSVLNLIDGCTGPSDTATFSMRASILVGAATRYDPGFWIALDGGNAKTGSCYKEFLTPLKSPQVTDPSASELTSGVGPYLDDDGDDCGDGKSSYNTFSRTLSVPSDPTTPAAIVLPCQDFIDAAGNAGTDGKLDFWTCSGWRNSSGVDCAGLANAGIPDVSSKCNCEQINVDVSVPAADPLDWGDAPTSYGTLSAAGGARHDVVGAGPRLGDCVDSEADGQPNANATGDDANSGATTAGTCAVAGDDEDGVVFGTLVPGEPAAITVTATAPCTLSAFIDWGSDGSFATAGDDILPSGQVLSTGSNVVNVNVPAGAVLGNTYARFRCTTAGKVAYNGLAADGEVEDYRVAIVQPGTLSVIKKAMVAGGTCGVDDVLTELEVPAGTQVEFCYSVTATGSAVYDVTLVDDMATPSDPSDDQVIALSGLTNLGGSPSIGDLAAGSTATGKSAAPVQF